MQGKRTDLLVISKVVPKIWARTNSAMATENAQRNRMREMGGERRSDEYSRG